MSEATEPPRHVTGLAEQRAKARAERDFAAADVLRAEIEEAGWLVHDTAGGFELTPKPPFEVWPTVAALPVSAAVDPPPAAEEEEETGESPGTEAMVASQVLWDASLAVSRVNEAVGVAGGTQEYAKRPTPDVTVGLVVDGGPAELRKCVDALIAHTDAGILALDLGDVEGAGTVLHELAAAHPGRIRDLHVAERPHWRDGSAGWGASRTKLLRIDTADVHVVLETSTVLDGDAVTPLVEAVRAGATAAGWRGAEPGAEGEWHDAGPGRVRALRGNLFAVRRSAALEAGGFPDRAFFHRHADLEFSLTLPGELVVPEARLPVHQERGRDDVDQAYEDRESRRTHDRVLNLLRTSGPSRTP
ncbi:hypothetical protein Misp01_47140 [Microtetraspora sp. NBRC 13810]|uniref:glycosyltransferase family 2 protein n=1 Tax=Microtetraspora sp. NBRC 13810 TaxID=3030990 RepID=UPI0024A1946C|nr:hypothetical protein [Microtetraspora sp. NBRC 13810]GLW09585.1 hypothetical protein Misp01_47140 [Microtetraspora sp. NBRC 13810]